MKKLPKTVDIDINNGINVCGIKISTIVNREIPTILYKDEYYISINSWVYLEFGIHSDNSYFLVDDGQRILRIILDYPHKLNLSDIEKLKLYENVTIESNLSMETESPYLIIEISQRL